LEACSTYQFLNRKIEMSNNGKINKDITVAYIFVLGSSRSR
jgi:hypothetical protein